MGKFYYWPMPYKSLPFYGMYCILRTYRQTSNISRAKSQNGYSSRLAVDFAQSIEARCREWKCTCSSAPNYIWVINNFIAYLGATYIGGLAVFGRFINHTTECSLSYQSHCSLTQFQNQQAISDHKPYPNHSDGFASLAPMLLDSRHSHCAKRWARCDEARFLEMVKLGGYASSPVAHFTVINFDPSMATYLHPLQRVGWNYLSIP